MSASGLNVVTMRSRSRAGGPPGLLIAHWLASSSAARITAPGCESGARMRIVSHNVVARVGGGDSWRICWMISAVCYSTTSSPESYKEGLAVTVNDGRSWRQIVVKFLSGADASTQFPGACPTIDECL